ncbi:hypothetical protein MYCTH_94982 [Thermothelomyces thermophilus ATCC 42464]|uniref:Extracellular membrane protein CFEM domain-containing protein n=1 Tax=Thermothelomyces thermophilus (strain ATCC 42464 / BCRC 31852 / DSM 1799) TaxID=573729 RepID=G2QHU0_THET4|nr:uncharacterized protein MYCTH_94982 [Thermothelomyces thermophilus ATCC 42464]AEO58950.1 hypothetical protein MYCTH_94982 [Thermothelomyces thermophilus ATCC 42464]
MARPRLSAATMLALAIVRTTAASIEYAYVTDMPAFSAPEAVGYNIQSLTYDACPEAVSTLQSCVCTKSNNFANLVRDLGVSVSYECGSTASEGQASAQSVLNAYCNPSKDTLILNSDCKYATYNSTNHEVPRSWARCPTEAPALASCACKKNQNSFVVSQLINPAKSWCAGHMADVSSAQAMFAAYCAMNDATTKVSGAVHRPPPRRATQPYDLCPGGPQALASCVCLKEGMTGDVLKLVTSSVEWHCSLTATEDISSAVAVTPPTRTGRSWLASTTSHRSNRLHMQQQQQQQHRYLLHQVPSPAQSPHPQRMQPGYQSYNAGTPLPGLYGQQQQQQQPRPEASWRAGPVPDLHEMDAGHRAGGMEQR